MLMLKLASRNLLEHRRKTLTVGGLMAFAIGLMIVASSVMSNISSGMESSFTGQYTGDLFIRSSQSDGMTVFGFDPEADTQTHEPVPDLAQQLQSLSGQPDVASISPQQVGIARVNDQKGSQSFSLLWGVDPEHYQETFSGGIDMLEGGFWSKGEPGILLNQAVADELDRNIAVGDKILLTAQGAGGTKIREVTVSGLFQFNQIASPQLEQMSLFSDAVGQGLFALNQGEQEAPELTEEEAANLGDVSDDSLFGDSTLTSEAQETTVQAVTPTAESESEPEPADQSLAPAEKWHFALVKLAEGTSQSEGRAMIEAFAEEHGLDWTVVDWQDAAGFVANLAGITETVLNAMIGIIGLVSVIIIMNTLVISVTERMAEIGTMRALGAQKGFVRKLITCETLVIAIFAGLVGLALAGLTLGILNLIGLTPPAGFFEILFGGEVLHPSLSVDAVLEAAGLITITALVASLYPIAVALRVSPVQAMQA